jgi:hypothetical protein
MNKDFVVACELKTQYETLIEPYMNDANFGVLFKALTPRSAAYLMSVGLPRINIPNKTQRNLEKISMQFMELYENFENNRIPETDECEED